MRKGHERIDKIREGFVWVVRFVFTSGGGREAHGIHTRLVFPVFVHLCFHFSLAPLLLITVRSAYYYHYHVPIIFVSVFYVQCCVICDVIKKNL